MLALIEALDKKVDAMVLGARKSNNDNYRINPKTGRSWKRYFWTCGCCDHHGRTCENKAEGHMDDATFRDRKKGMIKTACQYEDDKHKEQVNMVYIKGYIIFI